STGAFAAKYPELCPDGHGITGTDETALALAVQAEIPRLIWPLATHESSTDVFFTENRPTTPDTLLILDLIEFCYRIVANPIQSSFHAFFGHHHLIFDITAGKTEFRSDINRILRRNNLAYELDDQGFIFRIAPPMLRETLVSTIFKTGDLTLDRMLADGRFKFLNADPQVRREALERLWDCWERIKSLEDPSDKRNSVEKLLVKASSETNFRQLLDNEAKTLTNIGNSFHIRHSEVTQSAILDSEHVDYLFHRLFSLVQLLLNKRGGK
ncbi:MAG: hypothetical protein KJZ93_05475, partial [Caldilineaceae bacterium]|nr:hypothetical protein [Caldilineaceae bacterium]